MSEDECARATNVLVEYVVVDAMGNMTWMSFTQEKELTSSRAGDVAGVHHIQA